MVKQQDKSLTLKEMRWYDLKQENVSNEKLINTKMIKCYEPGVMDTHGLDLLS